MAIWERGRHLGVDTLLGSAHALHDHVRPQLFDDPIVRDDGPADGQVGLPRLMTALERTRIDERPPDDHEMTLTRIEWLEAALSHQHQQVLVASGVSELAGELTLRIDADEPAVVFRIDLPARPQIGHRAAVGAVRAEGQS